MGKRAATKRQKAQAAFDASNFFEKDAPRQAQLYAVGGRWDPLDTERGDKPVEPAHGRRPQRYQKTIKPRSDGQAELMHELDDK